MLSLDEQCKRDRGTNACFVSSGCSCSDCAVGTHCRTGSTLLSADGNLTSIDPLIALCTFSLSFISAERCARVRPIVLLRQRLWLLRLLSPCRRGICMWRWTGKAIRCTQRPTNTLFSYFLHVNSAHTRAQTTVYLPPPSSSTIDFIITIIGCRFAATGSVSRR